MKKVAIVSIIVALVVVLLIGGIIIFTNQNPVQNNSPLIPSNSASPSGNVQTQFPPQNNPSPSPTAHNIAISGFAFSPSSLTINAGDTVVWTNEDSVAHTIVSDSGNELTSSAIPSGGTYSHTFTTAGTFGYHCSIHPSMTGEIVVQ